MLQEEPLEVCDWLSLTSEKLCQYRKPSASNRTVVLLPVGSCEQHGDHLPVGTDTLIVSSLAKAVAHRMKGMILALPTLWIGYSPHHMGRCGTLSLEEDTLIALLYDICYSVHRQGFRKLLILNGHGGNEPLIAVAVNKVSRRLPLQLLAVTYWRLIGPEIARIRKSQIGGAGHACEFETSLGLYLFPKFVKFDRAVSAPIAGDEYFSPDMFAQNKVICYVDYTVLSPSGTVGDPLAASVQEGEEIFTLLLERICNLINAFSADQIAILQLTEKKEAE